jgi:hypothetical protein
MAGSKCTPEMRLTWVTHNSIEYDLVASNIVVYTTTVRYCAAADTVEKNHPDLYREFHGKSRL